MNADELSKLEKDLREIADAAEIAKDRCSTAEDECNEAWSQLDDLSDRLDAIASTIKLAYIAAVRAES